MEPVENTTLGAPTMGDWLTVAEFAALFRVEPPTIYAAIHAGEIPGVIRIGTRRGYRIPRASVAIYHDACRVTPSTPNTQEAPLGPTTERGLVPAA